ncbi:hypothetical protein FHR92_000885 [Fontibacillus solani]|uniref:Uncharacterized protein n=1 Tax=Fontibacillus solani TaxID=1572857 RepID=A0A7W3SQZ1_9BACL|nr:hypothetical protein [Fontibacillus solani]MBA9084428.1 hypothetical protein [Fontibacillus solani]
MPRVGLGGGDGHDGGEMAGKGRMNVKSDGESAEMVRKDRMKVKSDGE